MFDSIIAPKIVVSPLASCAAMSLATMGWFWCFFDEFA
jgi:hypothetical protein